MLSWRMRRHSGILTRRHSQSIHGSTPSSKVGSSPALASSLSRWRSHTAVSMPRCLARVMALRPRTTLSANSIAGLVKERIPWVLVSALRDADYCRGFGFPEDHDLGLPYYMTTTQAPGTQNSNHLPIFRLMLWANCGHQARMPPQGGKVLANLNLTDRQFGVVWFSQGNQHASPQDMDLAFQPSHLLLGLLIMLLPPAPQGVVQFVQQHFNLLVKGGPNIVTVIAILGETCG